jgi:hypothetical protein
MKSQPKIVIHNHFRPTHDSTPRDSEKLPAHKMTTSQIREEIRITPNATRNMSEKQARAERLRELKYALREKEAMGHRDATGASPEVERIIRGYKNGEIDRTRALRLLAEQGASAKELGHDASEQMYREHRDRAQQDASGDRVKITGGMKEFIGKTGRVQAKEDGLWRVILDSPVEVPGVGRVTSDLWEGRFLKKIG